MLRPKVVLWWGIAVTLLSAVLGIALPALVYGGLFLTGATPLDQGMLGVVQGLLQIVTGTVPVVGGALLSAGIVMAYLARVIERAPDHSFRLTASEDDEPNG